MNDRELTMLSFLADALVSHPLEFNSLISQVQSMNTPSVEYAAILENLQIAFQNWRPKNREEVAKLKNALFAENDKIKCRTAYVLNWGFLSHEK